MSRFKIHCIGQVLYKGQAVRAGYVSGDGVNGFNLAFEPFLIPCIDNEVSAVE